MEAGLNILNCQEVDYDMTSIGINTKRSIFRAFKRYYQQNIFVFFNSNRPLLYFKVNKKEQRSINKNLKCSEAFNGSIDLLTKENFD